MPTYEYKCNHCGHHFEVFQQISHKPIDKCPKCGKSVKRLIGKGAGIIFKGPGFYATDYRKPSPDSHSKGDVCPKSKEGCDGCRS